jgi:CheY-like chemotaxis protein
VGIDLQPQADRTEVERLLHQLRSALARLKAEVELLAADHLPVTAELLESVNEAIALVGAVQSGRDVAESAAPSPDNGGQWSAQPETQVIIIDNDLRLAELTARQLERLGVATNAIENLEPIASLSPIATKLVVDLSVLRLARTQDRDRIRGFRTIVVSGSADPLSRYEALAYGAMQYMVKPVEPEALRRVLAHLGWVPKPADH